MDSLFKILWETTVFSADRKSCLDNVQRSGFERGGTKRIITSKRSTHNGIDDNCEDSVWSLNIIMKYCNQQPTNITIMINKTLFPLHA